MPQKLRVGGAARTRYLAEKNKKLAETKSRVSATNLKEVISQKLRERRSTDGDALLAQALKNFAAVLLRLGINAPRAESLLRTAFIDAAETYARSQGSRVNQSLIATLAGINRVDVRKALKAR